jgi:oligopeptidase B
MSSPTPPVAERRPHTIEAHGDVREDPYFWLREKDSEDVLAYLAAENEYADAVTAPLKDLEDKLFEEIKGRIPQKDESVPQVARDGWWYSSRIDEGEQYGAHFRTRDGVEQVLLDLNELGKEHAFLSLGGLACPPNSDKLWYSLDTTGDLVTQLYCRDVAKQEEIDVPALRENPEFGRVAGFVPLEGRDDALWFVTLEEETLRASRLYFWKLGDEVPRLVMHEEDERFSIGISKTSDFRHILIDVSSHVTDEVWVVDAASVDAEPALLFERQHEIEIDADHYGDHWFLLSNAADDGPTKRNYELVRASDTQPNSGPRKVLIPHREHVLLEGFSIFKEHMVVCERSEGITALFVYDFKDGDISNRRQVRFPERLVEAELGPNFVTDTHLLRVGYQSLTTPGVTYDCDMRTMELTELKRRQVLGDFDSDDYVSHRVYATAEDGTQIPITLAHRKDTPLNGLAPCYLTGYGAYGLSYEMYFGAARISLLDRGFVFAIAHIRGGSEMGKRWHDAGKMENKKNTFTDFIACAELLATQEIPTLDRGAIRITGPRRLCVEGRSAGGLLMGAVVNMRPDLFGLVYAGVPFVDVLTTMLDETMPLVVGEYEEWGNPQVAEQYGWMKEYSPYDHVEAKPYPAMLVRTGYNDSQVMYWEPAKWVAKLRAMKTDKNPLVFRCTMEVGHGGSSGRFDAYREKAQDLAFILAQLRALS